MSKNVCDSACVKPPQYANSPPPCSALISAFANSSAITHLLHYNLCVGNRLPILSVIRIKSHFLSEIDKEPLPILDIVPMSLRVSVAFFPLPQRPCCIADKRNSCLLSNSPVTVGFCSRKFLTTSSHVISVLNR